MELLRNILWEVLYSTAKSLNVYCKKLNIKQPIYERSGNRFKNGRTYKKVAAF